MLLKANDRDELTSRYSEKEWGNARYMLTSGAAYRMGEYGCYPYMPISGYSSTPKLQKYQWLSSTLYPVVGICRGAG